MLNTNNYSVLNSPKAAMPSVIDCYVLLFTTIDRQLAIASCANTRVGLERRSSLTIYPNGHRFRSIITHTFRFRLEFSTCLIVLCVGFSSSTKKKIEKRDPPKCNGNQVKCFFINVFAFVCSI